MDPSDRKILRASFAILCCLALFKLYQLTAPVAVWFHRQFVENQGNLRGYK